jgi:hypothetical protein
MFARAFVRRLPASIEESDSSAATYAEPKLVAAIMAVEMSVRGPIWRKCEWLFARLLMAIGWEQRVASISLGPAQIQPGTAGLSINSEALRPLISVECAFSTCSEILGQIRASAGLSAAPSEWSSADWQSVGRAYNGSADYGDVIAAAYAELARR